MAKRDVPGVIFEFIEKFEYGILDYLPGMYASGEPNGTYKRLNDDDITKPYFMVSSWEGNSNSGFANEEQVIKCVEQALSAPYPSEQYHVDVYKFPEGYKMDFNISLVKEND